ncbi:MAG: septum formation protein [Bradymonadia bacterium]|jgi:septum formation protein
MSVASADPAPLILASTSRYRRALLERLGHPFDCIAPGVDERLWKGRGLSPRELVRQLALAKATAVASAHPGAIVIGSDQCASLDGAILGKPHTRDNAIAQLVLMAGRTHELLTGVAVIGPDGEVTGHIDVHRLTMRTLGVEAIARYVDADEPLDCAGSYKIEGRGVALFERVEGDDGTAIIGLPLMWVARTLTALGVVTP